VVGQAVQRLAVSLSLEDRALASPDQLRGEASALAFRVDD